MDRTAPRRCARCGRRLRKGGVYYTLTAELASSFDGYIIEGGNGFEERLEKIQSEVAGLNEEELQEQVYKKYEYLVCSGCRDEIDRLLKPEHSR